MAICCVWSSRFLCCAPQIMRVLPAPSSESSTKPVRKCFPAGTNPSVYASVKTRRESVSTSRNMPLFSWRSPFGPAKTVLKRPPGRTSRSASSTRQGFGQYQDLSRSVSVQHRQTLARGASMVTSSTSVSSSFSPTKWVFISINPFFQKAASHSASDDRRSRSRCLHHSSP